jgi:hypothetical protein
MFTKDNRTENFLTSLGASSEYTNRGTPDKLFPKWDKENMGRPKGFPIREEAVLEYAALSESGSPAPAPICHVRDDGLWGVLDGIQRLTAAFFNGETKFSAYLVTSDSKDLLLTIRVLANARIQGHQEPMEWTKRKAIQVLIVERGMSPEEVARCGGWQVKEIIKLVKVLDWGFKIRAIGGPELPDTMIEVVSKYLPKKELTAAAEPIAEFLNTVKAAKFSANDAEPYVHKFFSPIGKPSKRHEIYAGRLENFNNDPEIQTRILGRRGFAMKRDVVLMRTLKSADTVLDEIIADSDDIPYVDEFFRILKGIDKKLKSVSPNKSAKTARVPADMWSK